VRPLYATKADGGYVRTQAWELGVQLSIETPDEFEPSAVVLSEDEVRRVVIALLRALADRE
jgi:hypothetical protein